MKFTQKETTNYLNRVVKRMNRAAGYIVESDPHGWWFNFIQDGKLVDGEVVAHTRSEARARIKQKTGVKVLPPNLYIERLEHVPYQPSSSGTSEQ